MPENNMKGKIFNAQEVQAILNGSKVMFREVVKPLSKDLFADELGSYAIRGYITPPYQVGQKIFVKEKFAEVEVGAGFGYSPGKQILYRADDDYVVDWSPAQHMKQEQSRLTLQIKSIGVERLQDISEEDAIKEGMEKTGAHYLEGDTFEKAEFIKTEINDFKTLWNATHKKPEEKFEANPWVWKVEFEVINN
jgi:hypothetical protein